MNNTLIKLGKILLNAFVDAIFMFGIFAITSNGEISKVNHIRWFIYGFALSLTLQFVLNRTIVTFNRFTNTKNPSLR